MNQNFQNCNIILIWTRPTHVSPWRYISNYKDRGVKMPHMSDGRVHVFILHQCETTSVAKSRRCNQMLWFLRPRKAY